MNATVKKHLQVVSALSLSVGMIAFKANASEKPTAVANGDASTALVCKDYQYFQKSGKTVICYGAPPPISCSVC